jgi:SHS2 domain-containing protein
MIMAKDFEIIPHTADIKIRVYGNSLEELFKHALIGMFQSIQPLISGCRTVGDRIICDTLPIKREISVESPDVTALLVDFLSEALYLSDVHNEAYLDVFVQEIDQTHVLAILYGAEVRGFEVVEIKAVTYHELEIVQKNGVWQADIVFDI